MSVVPTYISKNYNDYTVSVENRHHGDDESVRPPLAVLTLKDILSILFRHKFLIFFVIAMALGATYLYTLSIKPSYRANAIVQIEREGAQIVNFGQTRKSSGVFDIDKDPFFRTRYEMLKGRVLSNRVIEELNLYESLEGSANQKIPYISEILTFIGIEKDPSKVVSIPVDHNKLFSKNLTILPIDGTHLFKVD